MITETGTAHTHAPILAEVSTCRLLDNWDKGMQLLAAKGFAQVSIRELAACMGVSPGALYHHYPSKQTLLFGIVEDFYDELLAALLHVDVRTEDPVGAVILAHLDVYEANRWRCCIAVHDRNCLTPHQLDDLGRLVGRYQQCLSALLGIDPLESNGDSKQISELIGALLRSMPLWDVDSGLTPDKRKTVLGHLLRGAIEGALAQRFGSHCPRQLGSFP